MVLPRLLLPLRLLDLLTFLLANLKYLYFPNTIAAKRSTQVQRIADLVPHSEHVRTSSDSPLKHPVVTLVTCQLRAEKHFWACHRSDAKLNKMEPTANPSRIHVKLRAESRNRRSDERSGLRSGPRENQPRRFTQWRRDDAGYENVSAAESTISSPFSNTSSTLAASFASAPESTISSSTSSIPSSISSISAESSSFSNRTSALNPAPFSLSQSSGAFITPSSAAVSQITHPANISVSQSDSASVSVSAIRVPIYGGVNGPLTDESSAVSLPTNPIASGSGSLAGGIYQASYSSPDSGASATPDPAASASAATSSAEFTTFSLQLFPPGFPTPAKHSVVSLSTDTSSADASSAPRLSLPAQASPESSPFSGRHTAAAMGTSATAALATSKSLSRTFAHNIGGIVGVVFGVLIALLLGVLFVSACRRQQRSRRSQSQKLRLLGISPPLQGDDGLNDAYSPVARRRARGKPTDLLRPLSSESADRPASTAEMEPNVAAYDVNNDHYDTDTWAIPTPPPIGPTASDSPFVDPLSPEFYVPSTPSSTPSPPTPSPISGKGFMRRLRRGRPSLASRGLLTTLAPVTENPSSPGPSVTELSRPSSLQDLMSHAPALVSRPVPPTAPPVPSNYSLPWIHRTRVTTPVEAEMAQTGWNPPATWAI
ncbi:hypothetical protein DFH08DRAFT_812837 [Mycena albidolilacea]|uniref:Uncharacterized protein n=1 Tax=Mycena albidolilacea TaxID=1033008 RepID=A0AAD7EN24_9AGAR|nr:hypothetical protein DFH08DRAFT_812837 [Mycena albidolilacea]